MVTYACGQDLHAFAASSHSELVMQIPLAASDGRLEERRVICWEWKGNARDEGEKAAQWVSEVVGQPSRLVRFIGESLHYFRRHIYTAIHTTQQHGIPVCSLASPLQTLEQ